MTFMFVLLKYKVPSYYTTTGQMSYDEGYETTSTSTTSSAFRPTFEWMEPTLHPIRFPTETQVDSGNQLTVHSGLFYVLIFGNILLFLVLLIAVAWCIILYRRKKISGKHKSALVAMEQTMNEIEGVDEQDEQQESNPVEGAGNTAEGPVANYSYH